MADWFEQTPGDRVVVIEDTPELQCALPNYVALRATQAADEAKLLETALRLIPKRIVMGEVRSKKPGPCASGSVEYGTQWRSGDDSRG